MKKKIVVLDYDGTLTDTEEEGKDFVGQYTNDLCLLLDKKPEEFRAVVRAAEAEIAANPDTLGCKFNGLITSPALIDPYMRIRTVASLIFDQSGAFPGPVDRERLLEYLFKNNYSHSETRFKSNAKELLSGLLRNHGVEVYIVTNSGTESVRRKISTLGVGDAEEVKKLCGRVLGNAKKFMVNDRPFSLPETMRLPGLGRPIYLRRSTYFDTLEFLRHVNGAEWEDFTVIGDVLENDLVLPYALGARIGLIVNQFTPEYEKAFIKANPAKATLINSLDEILPFVLK